MQIQSRALELSARLPRAELPTSAGWAQPRPASYLWLHKGRKRASTEQLSQERRTERLGFKVGWALSVLLPGSSSCWKKLELMAL